MVYRSSGPVDDKEWENIIRSDPSKPRPKENFDAVADLKGRSCAARADAAMGRIESRFGEDAAVMVESLEERRERKCDRLVQSGLPKPGSHNDN